MSDDHLIAYHNDSSRFTTVGGRHPSEAIPDMVYGVLGLLTTLIGFFGNSLAVKCFYNGRKHISNRIYLFLALTDIATSIAMFPFGFSRLNHREPVLFGNKVVCNLSGVIFSFSSQLAVFFVALQSVLRCRSLMFPLKKINNTSVRWTIGLYVGVQLVIAAFPFMPGTTYIYYRMLTHCNFRLSGVIPTGTLPYKIMLFILALLPFFVPAVPVVISCGISVFILVFHKQRALSLGQQSNASGVGNGRSRKASMTILIITCVYILLNVPYWLYLTVWLVDYDFADKWFERHDQHTLIYTFMNPFSIMLNAAINPVIYFIRIQKVRKDFIKSVNKPKELLINCVKGNQDTAV